MVSTPSAKLSADDTPQDPWIGRVLDGRYRVLERLGQGGMGTIYVAEHLGLQKQVALKLVSEDQGDNAARAQRFMREAMLTARIEHPNVISALDFVTFEDGTAFLAMHLVRGPTLAEVLYQERCLPWPRAAEIGAQIADALWAAQALGIVHRDLKPENVILQRLQDGTDLVKVLDFGIAKYARDSLAPPPAKDAQAVTRTGTVIGTPGYMSPEQAVGKPADHRSDLYSLGVLLWEAVVGRPLWDYDDLQTLISAQLKERPPSVRDASGDFSIDAAFVELVSRLLETQAEHRPQSAAEVRDALRLLVLAASQSPPTLAAPAALQAPRAAQPTDGDAPTRTTQRRRAAPDPSAATETQPEPTTDVAATETPPDLAVEPVATAQPAVAMTTPFSVDPELETLTAPLRTTSATPASARPKARLRAGLLALAMTALTAATATGAWLLREHAPSPTAARALATQPGEPPAPAEPMLLAEGVRPILRALVAGATREERVAAAEELLRYVPAEEVPGYARAMAHLQVAQTCLDKKERLAALAALDDPRTLPVLITLAQRKRSGCGADGTEDCIECLRDDLQALVTRLESRSLTAK